MLFSQTPTTLQSFFAGEIPPSLGGLVNLKLLDLGGNNLSGECLWIKHPGAKPIADPC